MIQGGEGGGHTGTVPTTLLLPTVLDAVDIPVVAAGGFFDGRGLAAALSYGAAGVGMGTRFLLTQDSTVPDAVKQRYLAADLNGTVVTAKVDGMPHRMLRTELVEQVEETSALRRLGPTARRTLEFKRMSGMSWPQLAADGYRMRREQGRSLAPDGPRRQHADDAQGRPRRGRHRRRRAGQRPGRRRDRRPADLRGARRPGRHRGGRLPASYDGLPGSDRVRRAPSRRPARPAAPGRAGRSGPAAGRRRSSRWPPTGTARRRSPRWRRRVATSPSTSSSRAGRPASSAGSAPGAGASANRSSSRASARGRAWRRRGRPPRRRAPGPTGLTSLSRKPLAPARTRA